MKVCRPRRRRCCRPGLFFHSRCSFALLRFSFFGRLLIFMLGNKKKTKRIFAFLKKETDNDDLLLSVTPPAVGSHRGQEDCLPDRHPGAFSYAKS